jgi:hypothetical protein
LIEPSRELTPLTCREKIRQSTDNSGLPIVERGGYITHDKPKLLPTNILSTSKTTEPIITTRLLLLIRGNNMSGQWISSGNKKLPKPPIRAGITMKKIMTIPWRVKTLLYSVPLFRSLPPVPSSHRRSRDNPVPTKAPHRLLTKKVTLTFFGFVLW